MSNNVTTFTHADTGDTQAAYEGSELYNALARDPEWLFPGQASGGQGGTRRELEAARDRIAELEAQVAQNEDERSEAEESEDHEDELPEGVTSKPGGWFELPDGSNVRGREAVDKWAAEQEANDEA